MRAKIGDGVMACGNATKDAEYNRLGEKNTPNCKWGMAVGKDKDDNLLRAALQGHKAREKETVGRPGHLRNVR